MGEKTVNTVKLTHLGDMRFEARDARGATAVLDSPPEGEGAGLSPMEFLLAALGGCTAMDVVGILRKKRQDVTDYQIEVTGERAQHHPKVYASMQVRHILTGRNLSEEAVRHAIELSEEKYCSAHAMLSRSAPITTSFEIRAEEPSLSTP